MKTDLATSIFAAVVGVVVAFVVCNLFLPPLEDVAFTTLSSAKGDYSSLVSPSEDVFNFRALNPTVEVYVGQCSEYDEEGRCKGDLSGVEEDTNSDAENGDENADENVDAGGNSDAENGAN